MEILDIRIFSAVASSEGRSKEYLLRMVVTADNDVLRGVIQVIRTRPTWNLGTNSDAPPEHVFHSMTPTLLLETVLAKLEERVDDQKARGALSDAILSWVDELHEMVEAKAAKPNTADDPVDSMKIGDTGQGAGR